MWERLDKKLLICYVLTTLAGIGLHYLFAAWPSVLTEFIAPVNESLWEHIKLIFWPYLLAGLYLTATRRWDMAPWLASLLILCASMLAGGWFIHVCVSQNVLGAHIALYLLLVGVGFLLPVVLPVQEKWSGILSAAAVVLCGLIILWTIQPPDADLFYDLTLADTFFIMPC